MEGEVKFSLEELPEGMWGEEMGMKRLNSQQFEEYVDQMVADCPRASLAQFKWWGISEAQRRWKYDYMKAGLPEGSCSFYRVLPNGGYNDSIVVFFNEKGQVMDWYMSILHEEIGGGKRRIKGYEEFRPGRYKFTLKAEDESRWAVERVEYEQVLGLISEKRSLSLYNENGWVDSVSTWEDLRGSAGGNLMGDIVDRSQKSGGQGMRTDESIKVGGGAKVGGQNLKLPFIQRRLVSAPGIGGEIYIMNVGGDYSLGMHQKGSILNRRKLVEFQSLCDFDRGEEIMGGTVRDIWSAREKAGSLRGRLVVMKNNQDRDVPIKLVLSMGNEITLNAWNTRTVWSDGILHEYEVRMLGRKAGIWVANEGKGRLEALRIYQKFGASL